MNKITFWKYITEKMNLYTAKTLFKSHTYFGVLEVEVYLEADYLQYPLTMVKSL